jgi:hypothetical protein
MRGLVFALFGATALGLVATAPAEAVGSRYPFCMQGSEMPGLSNCTFTSYQQCQATASGRFLYCIANPYYAGGLEPRESRRQRRSQPRYAY